MIDHEPQTVRKLRKAFAACGHDALVAPDWETALEIAARGRPDVVLLDPGLLEADPAELITGVRERTQVPIIVLTAHAEPARKIEALRYAGRTRKW